METPAIRIQLPAGFRIDPAIGEALLILRMIEHFFEAVEANVGCAVFAVITSFVMTGCLQMIWE